MKVCARCGLEKALGAFPRSKRGCRDGRHSYCRECFAEYARTRPAPVCRRCGGEKPRGRGRAYCLECAVVARAESFSRHRKAKRGRIDAYKLERGCDRCGYSGAACALDFHHRDPQAKAFVIAKTTRSDAALREEIAKCDLLCANCHRVAHHQHAA